MTFTEILVIGSGLAIGYWAKYQLDKRYVFRTEPAPRRAEPVGAPERARRAEGSPR